MTAIIIPAHNEAAVIHRCLSSLLDGAAPGEFDILVGSSSEDIRLREVLKVLADD